MFESRDGYFYSSKPIRHALVKKHRSKWRFPLHPETVLAILEDVPELRSYLDYDFYRKWCLSLDNIDRIKNAEKIVFDDHEFIYEPFEHQAKAIRFIRSLPACGLFMETGTGKTFCALVATEMRHNKGIVNKTLAIAPASVLKTGWFDDCKKFTHLRPIIVHPDKRWPYYCDECGKRYYRRTSAEKHLDKTGHKSRPIHKEIEWYEMEMRDRIYAKDYDIFITSPQLARIYEEDFINARFDQVILDESTMIKSPSSKMGDSIKSIGHNAKFRIAMTGTPVTNNLEDIWNQMKFVDMSLEDTVTEFRAKYFWQHPSIHYIRNPHKWAPEKIMGQIENRCIFVKKEDCLDLPDRLQMVREVPIRKKTAQVYNKFKDDLFVRHENKEIEADNLLTEALRLHQIINGFVTNDDGTRHIIDKNPPKAKETKEIMETIRGKAIIWAYYRHDFWVLENALKKYNPAVLAGKTNNVEEQVDKFKNDDSCRVMIAHPKSAKFGHTWNWATTTIFYSYGYSVEDYWQARDRNYRIGQKEKVTEIFLCSGGIELKILNAIRNNEDFAHDVMSHLEL